MTNAIYRYRSLLLQLGSASSTLTRALYLYPPARDVADLDLSGLHGYSDCLVLLRSWTRMFRIRLDRCSGLLRPYLKGSRIHALRARQSCHCAVFKSLPVIGNVPCFKIKLKGKGWFVRRDFYYGRCYSHIFRLLDPRD